jgi:Mak10 subunit, NatC N(alpha)-terminal acetyltransferase
MSLDITEELKAAAAALRPGELIAEPAFDLSQGMNALELMDPKLDPGVRPMPIPVAQRIKDKSLPLHDLSGEQMIAIMDHLVALEVSAAPL